MQRPPLPAGSIRVQLAYLCTSIATHCSRQCACIHYALWTAALIPYSSFVCNGDHLLEHLGEHCQHSPKEGRQHTTAAMANSPTNGWSPGRAMPAARRSRVSAHTPSRAPKRPAVPPPAALRAASSSSPCAARASSHATTRAALQASRQAPYAPCLRHSLCLTYAVRLHDVCGACQTVCGFPSNSRDLLISASSAMMSAACWWMLRRCGASGKSAGHHHIGSHPCQTARASEASEAA